MGTPSCIALKILARPRLKAIPNRTTDAATTVATITATTATTTAATTIATTTTTATTVVAIIAAIRSSASMAWSIDGKDSARQ